VDSTFAAGGYFCRPFDHGANIIIHSTTKWIAGHGTSVGGVVIDNPQIDWLKSSTRYPQFHGGRAGTGDLNLYQTYGRKAFSVFLKFEVLRDTGRVWWREPPTTCSWGWRRCLCVVSGRLPTPELLLSGSGAGQRSNGYSISDLRSTSPIRWPENTGYGTVLTFGLKGGKDAALAFVARLRLIKNTAK
jgi:O-acetylhomoserine/O-acetylserine sulfhydrylase